MAENRRAGSVSLQFKNFNYSASCKIQMKHCSALFYLSAIFFTSAKMDRGKKC